MRKAVVLNFVDAINDQDIPLIIQMMSENFYFIDTYGDKNGKEQMRAGWQGYFDWFPDYTIKVDDYLENEEFSMIIGSASGSYLGNKSRFWNFPACWKVVVKDAQIQLWQVFCDSKKQLDSMK
ncbi:MULTISPECIES: nuclear transport factor 2 family protein [unclassified Enterococcus]|uniref:nuclear transport factor 2 family protein n=1 Tax=unclassified Enterococcus TaxID=2608891 RepID=UPI001CE1EA8A|nr:MULTISPECIES: nuclear transport factor 2 family protein [unclassified Enterococcus]MCA5011625.1 nuclear transport factor 2 family protein [Enterococcus sp. S23]MCA5014933.1 nuclear transport factor 2 family protein [Enterococcus sp. S22(2020)]